MDRFEIVINAAKRDDSFVDIWNHTLLSSDLSSSHKIRASLDMAYLEDQQVLEPMHHDLQIKYCSSGNQAHFDQIKMACDALKYLHEIDDYEGL